MRNKIVEVVQLISGIFFLLFSIAGGVILFLERFEVINRFFNSKNMSGIWGAYDGGSNTTPIFLGLCGIAGAYLISNLMRTKHKQQLKPDN